MAKVTTIIQAPPLLVAREQVHADDRRACARAAEASRATALKPHPLHPNIMTHPRVTPTGQAMGKSAARLAERGQQRLADLGLADVEAPLLRADMCKTCACRPDTVPNGCLQTQLDFLKCAHEGLPFLCHSPKDGRLCAGWVRVRAEIAANPLPQPVVELLAMHEYSPPDAD